MDERLVEVDDHYQEYLKDESKKRGSAAWICFPKTIDDIKSALTQIKKQDLPITIQGGRTGISGGAVPNGGSIINLSRFNQVLNLDRDKQVVHVEAGVSLDQLKEWLFKEYIRDDKPHFWPMDPTEQTATIGGIIKTQAFGISSLYYGEIWDQIEKIVVIDQKTQTLISLDKDKMKEALKDDYIILEVGLKLREKPSEIWSIAFLFEKNDQACAFLDQLKLVPLDREDAIIAVVEYSDQTAIFYGNQMRKISNKINVPMIDDWLEALVFVEIHGSEEGLMAIAQDLLERSEAHEVKEENTWVFSGESEAERMHAFRHGIAEGINLEIEKINRDHHQVIKVYRHQKDADQTPSQVIASLNDQVKENNLQAAIYGCGLVPYLYCDFLPRNAGQMQRANDLIEKWA